MLPAQVTYTFMVEQTGGEEMTDKPASPFDLGRVSVKDGAYVRTRPLAPEVAYALNRWTEQYRDELADVLAPFGLHPYDVAQPKWERVVYVDELPKVGA